MVEKIDFDELKKRGKTIIYIESETELKETGWELWGKRITEDEEVFVHRKIVSLEEAAQYELENDILP